MILFNESGKHEWGSENEIKKKRRHLFYSRLYIHLNLTKFISQKELKKYTIHIKFMNIKKSMNDYLKVLINLVEYLVKFKNFVGLAIFWRHNY